MTDNDVDFGDEKLLEKSSEVWVNVSVDVSRIASSRFEGVFCLFRVLMSV